MQRTSIAAALAALFLGLVAGPAAAEFPAGTSPVLLPMPALPRGPFPSSFDDLKPSAQELAAASVVSRVLLDLAKDPKHQNPQKRGELEQMLRGWVRAKPILVAAITTQMRTQVTQLYVSLFGRAPDANGLGFWVNKMGNGESFASVAQQMYQADGARATYPAFLTNQEIIQKFYSNVLGKPADPEGLQFWTAKLNAKGATPGTVIAEMIHHVAAYTGSDPDAIKSAALFNNKIAVGEYFGATLQVSSITAATNVLAGVNADPASVTAAMAATNAMANPIPPATTQSTLDSNALQIAAQNLTTNAVVNSAANSPFAGQGGAGTTFTFQEVSIQVMSLNEAGSGFLGTAPGFGTGTIPTEIIVPMPPVTFSTVSQAVQAVAVNLVNGQQVTTQGATNVQGLVTQAGGSVGVNLQPTPLADIAALNAGNMGFTYNGTSAAMGQALSFFVSYGVSPFTGTIQNGTLPADALGGGSVLVNGTIVGNTLNTTFINGPNVVAPGSTFTGTLTGPSATGISTSYNINVNKAGGGTLTLTDTARLAR